MSKDGNQEPVSPCSRCAKSEQELAEIKTILADPLAVYLNVLHGKIAKISDENVTSLYPHLFENRENDQPLRPAL